MARNFVTGVVVVGFAVAGTSAMAFGPGTGHAGHGPRMSFEELDSDGDGQITQSEMQGRAAAHFQEADTDGNGLLSASEMEAQAQKRMAERIAGMIERFDKDGDGALSQDEMPRPPRAGRMFDHFDQDGSGGISEEEFSDAREEMRGRMAKRWGKHGKNYEDKN